MQLHHPSQTCGDLSSRIENAYSIKADAKEWADAFRPLIDDKLGLTLLKLKRHPNEPTWVKIYEGLAKNLRHHLPEKFREPGAVPNVIIKTFVITDEKKVKKPSRADVEVGALKWLNKRRCAHAPKLLCTFKMRNRRGRRKQVVVMKKIKGVTVSDRLNKMSKGKSGGWQRR